jgi:hypothetical protein
MLLSLRNLYYFIIFIGIEEAYDSWMRCFTWQRRPNWRRRITTTALSAAIGMSQSAVSRAAERGEIILEDDDWQSSLEKGIIT